MEKVRYRYADNALYEIKDGRFSGVICTNDENIPGKKVWGSGQRRVIENFYNGGEYPTLRDAENSAKALFAIYESSKSGCKCLKI